MFWRGLLEARGSGSYDIFLSEQLRVCFPRKKDERRADVKSAFRGISHETFEFELNFSPSGTRSR